jgi:uncharacterized ferredoxin-like protein
VIIKSQESEKRALVRIADLIATAARTSPKTRGIDTLSVITITGGEKQKLADKMTDIGEKTDMHFFVRDAGCVEKSECVVVLGVEVNYMGLNCGYCGHASCEDAEDAGAVCAFNNIDLGISVGSAISIAADNRADNRVMYSIGKAVLELGYFEESVKVALGIPLAAYGKNIFFDRK